MRYYKSTSTGGYSIITAILMIGFLLVLTVSTFNLVLQEMQDGRGRENYMKAYAGAEGSMELALLKMKQKGYGYFEERNDLEYFGSVGKNGTISYDIDSETKLYTGSLLANEYSTDIIPLFIIDASENMIGVRTLRFTDDLGVGLIWNVIGKSGGLSGTGDFTESTSLGLRTLIGSSFNFQNTPVSQLLATPGNYLTVFNPTQNTVNYTVEVVGANELFTKPKSVIRSSSKVGKYSQNLDTVVDNSEFLGILKYSIYSGE